ncbi:MAG: hypothetical protein HKP58_01490, partial [Desulfatitalea sp.]|nr:hypothetical protein [Desulfatitalea sp.]NNJ99060.1 hypothetical protein [Desulfatitalea sp.]
MSWHPLTLALWLTELASWGIYLGAARRLFMVIPTWSPESHSAGQLRRERAMELTIYQGKWVFALQVVILGLLLAGLCKAWPDQIPGAMCGTGVLQAMTPYGWQTLSYRMIALLVLFCCHVVAAIDRTSPEGPATQLHGRLLLVAGPFLGLATLTWVRSTAEVGAAAPVSCCAVLY